MRFGAKNILLQRILTEATAKEDMIFMVILVRAVKKFNNFLLNAFHKQRVVGKLSTTSFFIIHKL